MSATAVLPDKPQTAPEAPRRTRDEADTSPYLWTCDEYHRMIRAGFFDDKRVELLDGEILQMPAQLTPHATAVQLTSDLLRALFAPGHIVRVQMSLALGRRSEPEPDVLVVPGTAYTYARHHPAPADARLLVEIADSTLRKDRGKKARAYARGGVTDYWIVNLVDRRLEVYRDPQPDGQYQDVQTYGLEEVVGPLALPDAEVRVADLLPPEA